LDNFAQNWLDIQCKIITDCHCALLLMIKPGSSTLQTLAQWPIDNNEPNQLVTIAQLAVQKGANVINQNVLAPNQEQQAFDYFASPIFIDAHLIGVIAVKTSVQPEQNHQQIFVILDQSKKWLELANAKQQDGNPKDFYSTVVSLAAACLEQNSYSRNRSSCEPAVERCIIPVVKRSTLVPVGRRLPAARPG